MYKQTMATHLRSYANSDVTDLRALDHLTILHQKESFIDEFSNKNTSQKAD
jgi:hypothetical protein